MDQEKKVNKKCQLFKNDKEWAWSRWPFRSR